MDYNRLFTESPFWMDEMKNENNLNNKDRNDGHSA